jgi:hypothetical protein
LNTSHCIIIRLIIKYKYMKTSANSQTFLHVFFLFFDQIRCKKGGLAFETVSCIYLCQTYSVGDASPTP